MRIPEKRDHCSQRFAPAVDDRYAEHRAEPHLLCRIHEGEIGSRSFDVFNQCPPLHGEECGGNFAKQFDLLCREAGIGFHAQGFA